MYRDETVLIGTDTGPKTTVFDLIFLEILTTGRKLVNTAA
jgi:hypothetical protein